MNGMTPDDVYLMAGCSEPRISPDGRTVAFTAYTIDREANAYKRAIWLRETGGEPRRFTAGDKEDTGARWSPDGTRIAFTSNRDGETKHVYVIPVAGGEPQKLTDLKESAGSLAWSPNGAKITFVARVRAAEYEQDDDKFRKPRRITTLQFKHNDEGWTFDRRQHVFVVPADGSAPPVQITEGDFEHESPAWSPDGKLLAFAAARHDDWDLEPGSDIWLVAPEGGEPRRVTNTEGSYHAPAWSPDGRTIAARFNPSKWDDPRHWQIVTIDVATGARTLLTESLDRNCETYPDVREPLWDGDNVIFAVEDGGNTPVYSAPADGSGHPKKIVEGEMILTGLDVRGGTVAYTATTLGRQSELFVDGARITDVGGELNARALPVERFTAASADGTEIDCWIVRPPEFDAHRRYPALLTIHGGPFTQYGNKFFDEVQVYAAAGYVVLYCNPRGSSGYSEAFGRAIRGPSANAGTGWGSVDYEDCMACVDTALQRYDFIDGGRLGVLGGSYGGYMTSWIVGHTDRFQAAISERAVNDWTSMWGSSDFGYTFLGEFGAPFYDDPEGWWRISPVTYAKDIHTPLLILHSEKDLRCPIEQAEQLFTTLRLLKREVEFVRFPEETHELSRSGSPAHRVMRFELILEWFARYLSTDVGHKNTIEHRRPTSVLI